MFWTYRLQRDKFGETALHIAIANDLHDQVYQMLCAGADFDVADFFGKTSRQMLTQKLELTKDPTLEKIMKRLDRHENFGNERLSIWKKTNPMIKYADEGELHQMVFLQTIGGQVSQVQRAL